MRPVALPPGRYWIGDPCYVIPKSEWSSFLAAIDRDTAIATIGQHQAAVFRTHYGDGSFTGDNDVRYGVDSGNIAAVPMELVQQRDPPTGSVIDTPGPLICDADHKTGEIRFGSLTIFTGR